MTELEIAYKLICVRYKISSMNFLFLKTDKWEIHLLLDLSDVEQENLIE